MIMADISKIKLPNVQSSYNIKDSNARTNIGDLTQLQTTDKSSCVNAINELNTTIGNINDVLESVL
jgi:hypothetical protein